MGQDISYKYPVLERGALRTQKKVRKPSVVRLLVESTPVHAHCNYRAGNEQKAAYGIGLSPRWATAAGEKSGMRHDADAREF